MATVSKKKIKPLVNVLPIEPKDIDNAMKLATVYIPAFTEVADGIRIQRYKTG